MIIKHKHTQEVREPSFISWHNSNQNKEDWIVQDWGDLVMWQTVGKKGVKSDEKIIDRDHALRIIKRHTRTNSMRELTINELQKIKSTTDMVNLRPIEWQLLEYIANPGTPVAETKRFADNNGFEVDTINDVARALKSKYLVTLEQCAGRDQKTNRDYTSFHCSVTSLGKEALTNHLPQATPSSQLKPSPEVNAERINVQSIESGILSYFLPASWVRILKANKILTKLHEHPLIKLMAVIASIASIASFIIYLLSD